MKLGDVISYTTCYDTKPSKRLAWNYEHSKPILEGLNELPMHNMVGVVVGIRFVFMDKAELKLGCQTSGDGFLTPEYIPTKLSGPREKCYLVAYNLYRKPVLVRAQDIT